MAITSVQPRTVVSAQADLEGLREYVVEYLVTSDSSQDSLVSAMTAAGIPRQGVDTFTFGTDFDDFAVARHFSGRMLNNQNEYERAWLVTVTFSNSTIRTVDPDRRDDPLDEPAILSGSWFTDREIYSRDATGRACLNTANDLIEGLERDASKPTLSITKNFAQLDLTNIQDCINGTNTTTFFTLGPRMWKFSRARWSREFWGEDLSYFRISFEFEVAKSTLGWVDAPANRGFYYLSTDNDRVLAADKFNRPLNKPAFLNSAGALLATTASILYFDATATTSPLHFFEPYVAKDFGVLGIPTSDPDIV